MSVEIVHLTPPMRFREWREGTDGFGWLSYDVDLGTLRPEGSPYHVIIEVFGDGEAHAYGRLCNALTYVMQSKVIDRMAAVGISVRPWFPLPL